MYYYSTYTLQYYTAGSDWSVTTINVHYPLPSKIQCLFSLIRENIMIISAFSCICIFYLPFIQWQAAVACESSEEKHDLCESVFQGGEEEYGLLEALKFLMLAKAVELHQNMMVDQEVPVFCWLLFARDTSENPQTLLANHLSQIGFSGGVEQASMMTLTNLKLCFSILQFEDSWFNIYWQNLLCLF